MSSFFFGDVRAMFGLGYYKLTPKAARSDTRGKWG